MERNKVEPPPVALTIADAARRLAGMDYLDVQISLDGLDAATNDAVRGEGSYATARRAMDRLAAADFGPFKISIVVTRQNVDQLDGDRRDHVGRGDARRLIGEGREVEARRRADDQVDLR